MLRNLHTYIYFSPPEVLWKSGITINMFCGDFLEFLPIKSVLVHPGIYDPKTSPSKMSRIRGVKKHPKRCGWPQQVLKNMGTPEIPPVVPVHPTPIADFPEAVETDNEVYWVRMLEFRIHHNQNRSRFPNRRSRPPFRFHSRLLLSIRNLCRIR